LTRGSCRECTVHLQSALNLLCLITRYQAKDYNVVREQLLEIFIHWYNGHQ
jgi:hypothetical protein